MSTAPGSFSRSSRQADGVCFVPVAGTPSGWRIVTSRSSLRRSIVMRSTMPNWFWIAVVIGFGLLSLYMIIFHAGTTEWSNAMRATHELTVVARCPVEDRFDVYDVTVVCARTLEVEEIIK